MKKSNEVFRFCYIRVEGFSELVYPDKAPSLYKPYFEGHGGEMYNLLMDVIFRGYESNWTAIYASSFGSKDKAGSYTGCMASLMNNETDAAMILVDYPTDHFETVLPYRILTETQVKMLTAYTPHGKNITGSYVDIGKTAMASFKIDVYLMALFIVILGSLAFLFSRTWRSTNRNYSWHQSFFDSFSHIFLYDFEDFDEAFERIVSMTLTFTGFMLILYWSNLMSTELIVVPSPVTIDNYQQALDKPGLTVHFLELMTDHLEFRDGDRGSIERRLWQEKVYDVPGAPTFVVTGKPGTLRIMMAVLSKAIKKDAVLMASDLVMESVVTFVCGLKVNFQVTEEMNSTFPYAAMDPQARKQLKAVVVRRDSMSSPFIARMVGNTRTITEMDLMHKIRRVIDRGLVFTGFMESKPEEHAKCMFNAHTVVMPDMTRPREIKLSHLNSVFVLLLCGFALAFTSLMYEVVWALIDN